MRDRMRRTAAISVLAWCVGIAAYAQEVHTIRAGETLALASGASEIKVTTTQPRGKAVVSETAGTPKTYTLLYTAPDTSAVFTETITYTDPAQHSVSVTVTPADDVLYSEAFKSLFVLFVVALLLESGLAVVFNWRPFLVYFDGRGVKTLISVGVAFLFINHFDLDIVTRLVNVYSQKTPPLAPHAVGLFVTALIAAGGSAAVNRILVGLGFRSVKTAEQVAPKPPRTMGWVSVSVTRDKSVGPVDVLIGDPAAGPPVAGTITGTKRRSSFARLFIRDSSRYPMSGGFEVPAGATCKVMVNGIDANGIAVSKEWGPEAIAPGAIVDLDFKL